MNIFPHILLFLISGGVIWFFAGLLIESVNNVARRFHQSGFTVAFFVLGFLTSISEMSVMVNSSLNGVPEVSAGNLAGASLVILLFIIPFLAIMGKGIQLRHTLNKENLGLALLVAALPAFFLLDGNVSSREGLVCFLAYAVLVYLIKRERPKTSAVIEEVGRELIKRPTATGFDILKILAGGVFIFLAAHLLVEEAVYFSNLLSVPSSIIGLVVLSIGTNVPELVVAVRSILKKHTDIAFGDYLGSAVANTVIFAFLPFLNGSFMVEPTEFIFTAGITAIGFVGFFVAAVSKNSISKKEGLSLLVIYAIFLMLQLVNVIRFAND